MGEAFIYDHVRTPRGRGRDDGALHSVTPVQLISQVLEALRVRSNFDPAAIDDVGLGIVMPIGEQGADLTRVALLNAGYGEGVPGYQLNRYCTSSLDVVNHAAASVISGAASAVIAGGVESMSRVAIGSDGGPCYSDPQIIRRFPYMPNGVGADLMATLYGFDRGAVDAFAVESQRRAASASEAGYFDASLVAVCDGLGQILLGRDEAIRSQSTAEDLAQLKLAFESLGAMGYDAIALRRYPQLEAVNHVHTGGNSSGIVDGASGVLIGSESFGKDFGLVPRARIRSYVQVASEPLISLGGPMPATERLLKRTGMRVEDIDLFEVNEAFAAVPLAYMKHFGIDHQKLNVNGGAIALGHPLGATGAILLGTVLDELERRNLSTALITLCAAGGQATATIIERV